MLTRMVYLMCDGADATGRHAAGCPNLSPDEHNARDARRTARQAGWTQVPAGDYSPECAAFRFREGATT